MKRFWRWVFLVTVLQSLTTAIVLAIWATGIGPSFSVSGLPVSPLSPGIRIDRGAVHYDRYHPLPIGFVDASDEGAGAGALSTPSRIRAVRLYGFDWTQQFQQDPSNPRQWALYHTQFSLNIWLAIAPFLFLPAIWLGLQIRRWRRKRRSEFACEHCGYDLRATPERCPECGTAPAKRQEVAS